MTSEIPRKNLPFVLQKSLIWTQWLLQQPGTKEDILTESRHCDITNLSSPDEDVNMGGIMNQTRSRSLWPALIAVSKKGKLVENSSQQGFTIIELLVVIAVTAVLAVTLMPALAASRASTKADQCLANTRQLTLGWLMYAGDNRGQLMSYTGWVGVLTGEGWTATSEDNTNTWLLIGPSAQMSHYIKDPRVYKCPSDIYQKPGGSVGNGYRVRSYSLNGALSSSGSGPTVLGHGLNGDRNYFEARQMADLRQPSQIFVLLDEQGDSINDAAFMFDPGGSPGTEHWRDLPGSYHDGACCLSFADGHSAIRKWLARGDVYGINNSRTVWPVKMIQGNAPWRNVRFWSPDYDWMDDHMPYK
jgi:prepilin-type N-terminal cleavage/methylation domain-containing protein